MKKIKLGIFGLVFVTVVLSLTGCNNFFHDLIPPDGDRITGFSVPGQMGGAIITDDTVTVYVNEGTDRQSLLPTITVSEKASLLPLTMNYVQAAFPSVNIAEAVIGIATADPVATYALDMIRSNHDFNVPSVTLGIDFSGYPVHFLVVSGRGTMREYTVNVHEYSEGAKLLTFGFPKYENPDLVRDGIVPAGVDQDSGKISAFVIYPVEVLLAGSSPVLIPGFEIFGEELILSGTAGGEGVELPPEGITFDPWPAGLVPVDLGGLPPALLAGYGIPPEMAPLLSGVNAFADTSSMPPRPYTLTRYLTVRRQAEAGWKTAEYELEVLFLEDTKTARNITDFRFKTDVNPGLVSTAVASIVNGEATGTIAVQVLYQGERPASLTPAIVSPGMGGRPGSLTVSVDGGLGWSGPGGMSLDYYQKQIKYKVISGDGNHQRIYTVNVDYFDMADADPKMTSFGFPMEANSGLVATANGTITNDGRILVEVLYSGDKPASLTPVFASNGLVKVSALTQTSGASSQDFRRQLKYTVYSVLPGASASRDYWVEVIWTQDNSSAATISAFAFEAVTNPTLTENRPGTIDQADGMIYAYVPVGTDTEHSPLRPAIEAKGTVTVLNPATGYYEPADSAQMFNVPVRYRVTSQNGFVYKDYTVRVIEVSFEIYVNPDAAGLNTGTSWADAFINLSLACERAGTLDADAPKYIFIAKGNYQAGAAGFPVTPNTSYIGGFAGHEADKDARMNIVANTVTVSGNTTLFRNDALSAGVAANIVFEDMSVESAGSGEAAINVKFSGSYSGGITLVNTKFTTPGRAALSVDSGSVAIENSSFENCSGGAVRVKDSNNFSATLSIKKSRFANLNTGASTGSATPVDGGAVYFSGSNHSALTIEECAFENISGASGGAIYAANCTPTLQKLNFIAGDANPIKATGAGGAIYISNGEHITIKDISGGSAPASFPPNYTVSDIKHIRAAGAGAFIYITDSSTVEISNIAPLDDLNYLSAGSGAININASGNVNITNLSISNFFSAASVLVFSNMPGAVTLSGLSITNAGVTNGSTADGGAVGFSGVEANLPVLKISDSTFEKISGARNGGAIYAANCRPELKNLHFLTSANEYLSASGAGGAIYIGGSSNGDVKISGIDSGAGTPLQYIKTEVNGGTIYINDSTGITIDGLKVRNTRAGSSGGVIYINNCTGIAITGMEAVSTQAGGSGGAICIDNDKRILSTEIAITGMKATNTRAGSSGGAIYIARINKIAITGMEALDTRSEHSGGAIYYSSPPANPTGTITIKDSSFTNTSAAVGGGGAILTDYGTPTLTNIRINIDANGNTIPGTFTSAGTEGGAVCIYNSTGVASISNMKSTNTRSGQSGGTIYYNTPLTNPTGTIAIKNSSFSNTSAVRYVGGAIATDRGTPTLTTIRINTDASGTPIPGVLASTADNGGAITTLNCTGMTLHDIITYNTGTKGGQGGSMYLHNISGTASITKIKITKSKASNSAIDAQDGTAGAILIANYPGGVFKLGADAATQTNPDIIIEDSEAAEIGGAIWVHNGGGPNSSVILNGISTSNTCGLHGYGAIGFYIPDGGYTTITNSSITDVSATATDLWHWGSALYIIDQSLTNPAITTIKNVTINGSNSSGHHSAGLVLEQGRTAWYGPNVPPGPPEPPAPYHIVDIDGLHIGNATAISMPAIVIGGGPVASITMRNSQFNGCIATGGGSIFGLPSPVSNGPMVIDHCSVNDSPLRSDWGY
jgi:hypothetical protein